MERRIGERQRWVWLAVGLSAVAAVRLCAINWLWVLLGGLAACLYYLYIEKRLLTDGLAGRLTDSFGFPGKVLCVLLLFWIILVMGRCACYADTAFPMVDGFPSLGWVLLALAAWGSRKGPQACAGCSGILCLFLLALYGVIAVFSVPDIKVQYLAPAADWRQTIEVLGMFLLPAGVWCVPVRQRKGKCRSLIFLLPVFAAALSAVTGGVLSPEVAMENPAPLYELSRSVSVLGVVERIEPLISAAMTMGIFCLLSSLACACQALADQVGSWRRSGSLCCLAAAGTMYFAKDVSQTFLTGGNLAFFLFLPLAAAAVKKSQNFEEKGVDKAGEQ